LSWSSSRLSHRQVLGWPSSTENKRLTIPLWPETNGLEKVLLDKSNVTVATITITAIHTAHLLDHRCVLQAFLV
jgi:hypothetical protein